MKAKLNSTGRARIMAKAVIIFLLIPGIFQSCGPSSARKNIITIDPGFSTYISGYTAGVVSIASPITIQLAQATSQFTGAGQVIQHKLFDFDPKIEGKTTWVDQYTLEFQPAERMKSGTSYQVSFALSRVMDVPDKFKTLTYTFSTIPQNFSVEVEGVYTENPSDLTQQSIRGILLTADAAETGPVEKALSAVQNNHQLHVNWEHSVGQMSHRFTVTGVKRMDKESGVLLSWDGNPLGIKVKGAQPITIPSLGDFKVMNTRVVHFPQQYVALQFSDPILDKQDLDGLITMENTGDLQFMIDENEIRVYPPVSQAGVKNVHVNSGIKNILGYKLKNDQVIEVTFEMIKPAVRLVGKGVILPNSDNLVFPFEAVNLKAVDVRIIKIFENNITQFLQVNDIGGNYELKRVGYPVLSKTVVLSQSGVTDFGKWNRFTLDLSEMIKSDPGAIYQVQLGFKQAYSLYDCPGSVSTDNNLSIPGKKEDWNAEEESSNWDDYEDYYYPEGYEWNERDNPCTVSYFTSDKFVQSNLLASNLGLMAKMGSDGTLLVAVTDLTTTGAVSGAGLEIYDFQKQLIHEATTDGQGIARFKLDKKPFLLVASRNKEKGYLKLEDGNALSLSNFNVGGETVQQGIKGFIYGERGVWRPGDSVHLVFILEDKLKTLPDHHPVIMELYNPLGQMTQKIVRTDPVGDFYNFGTQTADDAPTGNWVAKVLVGGAEFSRTVKIETIKPNRLKINLDFGADRLVADKETTGNLSVKWLHGAIASNLKAKIDVMLREAQTSFPDFTDYTFDDPSRTFNSETYTLFEGNTDGQGNAKIPLNIHMESSAPGMLNAVFNSRVYEESGDFSVNMFSLPYYPYSSFAGLKTPKGDRARGMLLTDTTHQILIATVDAGGKGISRSGVGVEVYKLDWRWWWDSSDHDLGNYISSDYHKPVSRQTVNTVNGKGIATFRINYPEWGRYLIRVSDPVSGHSAGKIVYVDWPGWAGRGQKEMPGGATMLSFSTDKDQYQVGETMRLTFPGSGQGRAFISVENGSTVLDNYWTETKKGENIYDIKVTPEYSPNVFIYVSLLQPHAQTANDLPIRMYGVVPVRVDNPETHLKPVLAMINELKPGSDVQVKISEANGKPMAYTLAMVDDGLLDLTSFKTPDPWDNFYKREGLGVKTWDLFDEVVGAFSGNLERLLSVGGDQELKRPEGSKVNRFKPVVIFMGPYYLSRGETATHHFTMPSYIGSVRTMVVAGNAGAFGMAEKETPVRQPLMVLATLPRVLGPGEEVSLPVTVFSYDAGIHSVGLKVKPNDLFDLEGSPAATMSFSRIGDQVMTFRLKVRPKPGTGIVEVLAESGSNRASDRIEIEIRNPNPPTYKIYESVVDKGKNWTADFVPVGMEGTNTALLEVSGIPPVNLGRRINFLVQYPYGCVEQTTSAVFPQLYLSDITELDATMKASIEANIKAGIEKLRGFQHNDGGFKYWPESYSSDDWSSNYAGHFLVEAKKKGYNVPESMIRDWIKFQKRQANSWSITQYRNSDLTQAYRLYTLALAGESQTGNMNRLRELHISNTAAWRLAAAYQLAGMSEAANEITKNIPITAADYHELADTYGSGFRDEAMILEVLVLMNRREEGLDLVKKLSAALSDEDSWLSTQETAYALIALSSFAAKSERSGQIRFEYTWNDNKKISATTQLPFIQKPLPMNGGTHGKINIMNIGDGVIYIRLVLGGIPAIARESEGSGSLSMIVTYKDVSGNLVDLSKLKQGTELMAEISVSNPGIRGDYKELALSQIFPSGFEIVNERLTQDPVPMNTGPDKPDYQDIRDDRVYSYFDLLSYKRKMFRVNLIATYAGRFYMPGVLCEAMYDHSIYARTKGQWVEILPEIAQ